LRLELSEQQTFGITHAEVSAALLQKWGLPSSLISLVVAHHHSEADIGGMSQVDQKFLHVMQIGEAVANLADLCHVHRRQVLNRLLARYGEDKAPQCRAALEESVAKAVEASQLFSIPIPEDAELEALLQRLTSDGSLDETSPDASAPAELPSDDKTADSPSTADKSILVIENDEVVIQLVTGILSTAGFEVLTCPDSQRAEALAPRARAVLCDFHLRERDGAQLVAGLRQSGFRKPIIMMSGERKRSVVDQCIKAGITDFLPKPFSSEALLQKVNKHLVAEHA
jgi:CheY-like chemotaxis protein